MVWLGIVMDKNWTCSVDQCQLQALQFSVYLINLLSILFRYSGFAETQKAVVDQTNSRPPNSDHDLFLMEVWLWEVLWSFTSVQPLSWSSLVVVENPLFVARHNPMKKWFADALNKRRRNLKAIFFFFFQSAREALAYWGFLPFQFALNAKWP